MKELSNTEARLKKTLLIKKACIKSLYNVMYQKNSKSEIQQTKAKVHSLKNYSTDIYKEAPEKLLFLN